MGWAQLRPHLLAVALIALLAGSKHASATPRGTTTSVLDQDVTVTHIRLVDTSRGTGARGLSTFSLLADERPFHLSPDPATP